MWASQVVPVVKKLPANAGDIELWVQSMGQEDPLEEGMATHSSILASPAPKKGLKEISDTNYRIVRLCQEPLRPPPNVMIA